MLQSIYNDHKGTILDCAFSSLNFHPYFVTVSYDQSLNVYGLTQEGTQESKYRYHNEDSEVGFFTHVVFFPLK